MKVKDKMLVFVFILAILGLVLRIYRLGFQSLWIDEGFSINAASSILKHGYPLLESGIVYSGSLLNSYLIAAFMFFHNDVVSARLVSVIFGVLMIFLAYYFGKELGNNKIGLMTAVFVTFSIWEIAWSRQARMYMQFQFFFILSLLFFYRFINDINLKKFFLMLLFSLLAVFSHSLGLVLGLIYIAYFIFDYEKLVFIFNKTKGYIKNKFVILLLIVFFIFIVNFIYKGIINYQELEMNYFLTYNYYLKNAHFGFYYLGIIGFLIMLKNDFKKGIFIGLSFLIPFIFISSFIFLLHYRYLFFILPILFFLTAYLIDYVSFKKFYYVIALVLVISLMFSGFVFIPQAEYDLEKETPQPNFDKAYGFVKENMNKDDVVIDAYPALGYYYLGKVDYALNFSLTGKNDEEKLVNTDVYRNLTFVDINTLKELDDYWIVLDKLALRRLNEEERNYILNLTFYEEASEDKNLWSGVSVYRKE